MCLYEIDDPNLASVGKLIWGKFCTVTSDEMIVSLLSPAVYLSVALEAWHMRLVLRPKSLKGEDIKNVAVSYYDTVGSCIKVIWDSYHFIFSKTIPLISVNSCKLIGDFNDWCIWIFNDKQVLDLSIF